jgi:hypothetical protein
MILNDAATVPFVLTKTLDGDTTAIGPPETAGIMDPVRETLPAKPPMLESVILTNPVEPSGIVRKFGLVVMLKSGVGPEDMVSVKVAVCDGEPPVAVKTIEYVPGTALEPTLTKMLPVTFPPGLTVTCVVPTPTLTGMLEGTGLIVPANPLRLAIV